MHVQGALCMYMYMYYLSTMYLCTIECAPNRSDLVVVCYDFGLFLFQAPGIPPTHQECIALLNESGVEVQWEIEQRLGLKKHTLNHPLWTRIVRDRYRKLWHYACK